MSKEKLDGIAKGAEKISTGQNEKAQFDEQAEVDLPNDQLENNRDNSAQQTSKKTNIDLLLDVPLEVSVELGRTKMAIRNMVQLGPGSIIELDKLIGEPVDLLANNNLIARGEVVVFDENFGIRITDIVTPEDRIRSLR